MRPIGTCANGRRYLSLCSNDIPTNFRQWRLFLSLMNKDNEWSPLLSQPFEIHTVSSNHWSSKQAGTCSFLSYRTELDNGSASVHPRIYREFGLLYPTSSKETMSIISWYRWTSGRDRHLMGRVTVDLNLQKRFEWMNDLIFHVHVKIIRCISNSHLIHFWLNESRRLHIVIHAIV